MDIDGYDGSQLAPLNNRDLDTGDLDTGALDTSALDTSALDNSLTANVDQMFDITSVERNDNENNIGNQLEDNSTLNERNNEYIENMNNQPEVKKENKGFIKSLGGIIIFIVIWLILGLIAFITSLVCFKFSGNTNEKVLGLLIALLFGPFYFIYFYLNKNYCGKNKKSD